jgi:hypothetical protein
VECSLQVIEYSKSNRGPKTRPALTGEKRGWSRWAPFIGTWSGVCTVPVGEVDSQAGSDGCMHVTICTVGRGAIKCRHLQVKVGPVCRYIGRIRAALHAVWGQDFCLSRYDRQDQSPHSRIRGRHVWENQQPHIQMPGSEARVSWPPGKKELEKKIENDISGAIGVRYSGKSVSGVGTPSGRELAGALETRVEHLRKSMRHAPCFLPTHSSTSLRGPISWPSSRLSETCSARWSLNDSSSPTSGPSYSFGNSVRFRASDAALESWGVVGWH